MFELDVQLRGGEGGVLVCSHYLPLGRRPDRRAGSRALEVERDNWRLRRAPGRDPALTDVLALIPSGCGVLLDPKHRPGVPPEQLRLALARFVAGSERPGRFVVSTGDPRLLAAYRSDGVRTWRSIGDRAALHRAIAAGGLPEEGVSVRHSLLDAETTSALNVVAGIIVAWTVNSRRRATELVRLGVGGVTTDRLAVLAIAREQPK